MSNDSAYDPADTPLTPASQGPLSLAPMGLLTHTATSAVARPLSGSWYVVAVLDDGQVVPEGANENNNEGAIPVPLILAVDLVAGGITGPLSSGPLEPVVNQISLTNRGVDPPGAPVPYKIWVSSDGTLGTDDTLVHSGALDVLGGQTLHENVAYVLPANVPPGDYYWVLQLDDGPAPGVIAEVSEANNVKFGSTTFKVRQPDLQMEEVVVHDPFPPYDPVGQAFFGQSTRLSATLVNAGGATATHFTVGFYLSNNDTFNAFNDPLIGEVTQVTLAPGERTAVVFTGTMPTKLVNGTDIPPGSYFVFASATGGGADGNGADNVGKVGPVNLRGPAPDLVATSLSGPAQAGAGESMVVTCALRNVGFQPAPSAAYRFYLSANAIITEQDLLLPIQTSSGEVLEQAVTLGIGQEEISTHVVRVPAGAAPGTYYLGVLVDPPGGTGTGQVAETREDNNGLAGQTVEVVPGGLAFALPLLPDALVGLPYQFTLAARGGAGAYSFSIAEGTLPEGMTLQPSGHLAGVPLRVETAVFTLKVTSGGEDLEQRFVLQVIPLTASLQITSSRLPPPVRLAPYDYFLSAQGGRAPYLWTLHSGSLPTGLNLSETGRLAGAPSGASGTLSTFTLQVRDGAGNTQRRAYQLTVVDGGGIAIQTQIVPDGLVGAEYLVDLVAKNLDGTPLARPLEWTIAGGALPPGLTSEPLDDVLLVLGKPMTAGHFPFTLQVKDAKGRLDQADLVLSVHAEAGNIEGVVPEVVRRGDEVSVQLSMGAASVQWTIVSGVLPPGLSLNEKGALWGKVSADAAVGRYNFGIQAVSSGAAALRPMAIEVVDGSPKIGGCSATRSGSTALALWGLVLLLGWVHRVRH